MRGLELGAWLMVKIRAYNYKGNMKVQCTLKIILIQISAKILKS